MKFSMYVVFLCYTKFEKLGYFYKGSTGNLVRRLNQHNSGEVSSTKSRRPYRFVYYEAYCTEKTARLRESSVGQYRFHY